MVADVPKLMREFRELTGEARVREQRRLFRPSLLVLQVQEKRVRVYRRGLDDVEPEIKTAWRDATVADAIDRGGLGILARAPLPPSHDN